MRSPLPLILAVSLLALTFGRGLAAQSTSPQDPKRVLVCYSTLYPDDNKNGVGDSKELADYYAKVRGVPSGNVLGLKIASATRRLYYYSGSKAWEQFHDEMVTPIKGRLKKLGADKIDTILFAFGVPHSINAPVSSQANRAIDSLLIVPDALGSRTGWSYSGWWRVNPHHELSPGVGADKGRFNHATYKFGTAPMYLTCRLDGLNVESAKDLVDGAMYFEKHGAKGDGKISGNVVLDTRFGFLKDDYIKKNYPNFPGKTSYTLYDYRITWAKFLANDLKLPLFWEPSGNEIGETNAKWSTGKSALRSPDTLLYAGWYNYGKYLDVFDWLPGSVATDLNSNSLQRFQDKNNIKRSFGTGALWRGLTACCGVISEPYLSGHVRPEVLAWYIAKGYTFAEASSLSDPAIFWRGIRMGDPIYAPFDTRHKRVADQTVPKLGRGFIFDRKGVSAKLDVTMARKSNDPELCVVQTDFGVDKSLGTTIPATKAFHSRHEITLSNLDQSEPGYYVRPTLIDPAGNKTVGPYWAVTPRAFSKVEARVKVVKPAMKLGDRLKARFSVSVETGDLNSLTVARFFLRRKAGTWIEITGLMFLIASEPVAGPEFKSALFGIDVPFFVVGDFELNVIASTQSGTSNQTTSFSIK